MDGIQYYVSRSKILSLRNLKLEYEINMIFRKLMSLIKKQLGRYSILYFLRSKIVSPLKSKLEFEINIIIQKIYVYDNVIAWMVFNTASHAVKYCHHIIQN